MCRENMKHSDCSNFCPIDAAKGICRLTNEMIFIDTDLCSHFDEISKCKNCTKFLNPDKDGIGTCVGFKKETWSPSELKSTLCEKYERK